MASMDQRMASIEAILQQLLNIFIQQSAIADQVSQGVLACKLRSDSLVLGKCGPLLLELFLLALRRLLRYGLRVLVVRLRSLLVIVRA